MKCANHENTLMPDFDRTRWIDVLNDGTRVNVRPIQEDDIERERAFIMGLSPQSRRLRFLGQIGEPSMALLKRLTHVDYLRDAALVGLADGDSSDRFLGVGRFSTSSDGRQCECAVAVLDDWQHLGLGVVLMKHLIAVARDRGIGTMYSFDLAENRAMADLADYLGFDRHLDCDDASMVMYTLRLTQHAG